ncbi:uncharacterized protein LOC129721598 [Wyeomyia smithii]|uniref:uncharacterized protein LOC129721598 n=1 Tax=Wyeomyia smithii TaxID=174621 RepID=UPI002467FD57|nr:uncharacterized protein LOC129721598 [Wyeomyia smithii]
MKERLFQKCCRLCLDDTKQQLEIRSVERLDEALLDLYDLKISSKDRCSQSICVECYEDVSETQKWLGQLEKQKQLILANQARFREELLEQLGPEQITAVTPQEKTVEVTPPSSSTRITRRSARMTSDADSPKPKSPSIKKEPIVTRNCKRKIDWEAPQSEQESETATETTSNEVGEEEEITSETTTVTTTTTEAEVKCNKCEALFEDIVSMEKHTCEYICSICSKSYTSKWNLRRHLVEKHKIVRTQWQSYWTPKGHEKNAQSLLVETSRPKKRYRYESDSPTDLEESSNDQAPKADVEIICKYCGVRFDSQQELKDHDCEIRCNICGMTFAKRNYVKNHKMRVHGIEASELCLTASKSRPVSRAASRPPSRAATEIPENPSDDEPLSTLANNQDDESLLINEMEKTPGKIKYRYFCTECDYSNLKRYRLSAHLIEKHNFEKESIDPDSIPREIARSKTPDRSKTPQPRYCKTPTRAKTPLEPDYSTVPKTPDYFTSALELHQRGRSKSTYQDNFDVDYRRKRSYSSCSNKMSRSVRATSNPPPSDRNMATAKRRSSTAQNQPKIHAKFRPLLVGIDMNRLHLSIQPGCEVLPIDHQLRIRASSHHSQDPSSTKRLFRLKAPIGTEREGVQQLRNMFQQMSGHVTGPSKVASIGVEQLVFDSAGNPSIPTDGSTEQTVLASHLVDGPEGEIFEVRDVDTQNVTTIYQSGSEVVHVVGSAAPADYDDPNQSRKKKKGKKDKRRRSNVEQGSDSASQERPITQPVETEQLATEIKQEKIDSADQEELVVSKTEEANDNAERMEESTPVEPGGLPDEGSPNNSDTNVAINDQLGALGEDEIRRIIHDPTDLGLLESQMNQSTQIVEKETENNPPEEVQSDSTTVPRSECDQAGNTKTTQEPQLTMESRSHVTSEEMEKTDALPTPMEVDEPAVEPMIICGNDDSEVGANEDVTITPD